MDCSVTYRKDSRSSSQNQDRWEKYDPQLSDSAATCPLKGQPTFCFKLLLTNLCDMGISKVVYWDTIDILLIDLEAVLVH